MSEAGDFELFGAPTAKEHDEKSDEKFREEMRRAQKAMQQLQKEEGKARAHDDKLAQIIVQFLSQSGSCNINTVHAFLRYGSNFLCGHI